MVAAVSGRPLRPRLLLFLSALTQLVLLQLNMSEKNFPLHVKCKY